jgi:hypothetical protein
MTDSRSPTADTTAEAIAVQAEAVRRLAPLTRLELAWEMSEVARDLLRARLHHAHPEWAPTAVEAELQRSLRLGTPRTASR